VALAGHPKARCSPRRRGFRRGRLGRSHSCASGTSILPWRAMAPRVAGQEQSWLHRAIPPLRRRRKRPCTMTTNPPLPVDDAQAFLAANPNVQWIDAVIFEMNGIPRGKRIRRSDLVAAAKGGLMMPSSIFVMDPLGNCVAETGRLWETGDHDHPCHLLAGT